MWRYYTWYIRMGCVTLRPVGSYELPNVAQTKYLYIKFNFFIYFDPPKIKIWRPYFVYPTEISLNMIILILLSQYFHNNNMWQVVFGFHLDSQLISFFYLTTGNLDFFVEFLESIVSIPKFCSFIKKKKRKKNILSGSLAYFALNSGMKLFFLTLFFFISKKITSLLQQTNLYFC